MHHLPTSYLLQNRYLITRKIGQGGFGITYEAIDQELEKKVCIKELYIEGINQRAGEQVTLTETKKEFSWTYFIGNFKKEAQKIAEFRHSNIVSVSSVFEANGTAYYVMEYVEGENLKEYLNRLGRPFTEEEIKPIAIQIFDAVDTVHSKGLLHRDIKPDNFLITKDKQIVLIDFGSSRENMDEKTVALLASTTILMLTHGYSAPEMYSNLSVKGRFTDIYSLGATLYYLLSLKKPMPANDRQFAKMPALHEVNPQISKQFSSAVMLALELKTVDRFQSVGDFRLALQQMAGGQKKKEEQKTVVNPKTEKIKTASPKTVRNPETGKKNNNVLIYTLIIGLVLVLMLLMQFNRIGAALRGPEIAAEQETLTKGSETKPTDSPNDKAGKKPEEKAKEKSEVNTDDKEEDVKEANDTKSVKEPVMVQIPGKNYQMGKYEVTQEEWESVMGSNPSYFEACPRCPVENVSWNDVQDYIQKLNKLTGKQYRLPYEAEWEYAAKAGYNYKYSGSNDINKVAWYSGNSNKTTHEVGKRDPNNWGLFDITGNVWEWCQDLKENKYILRGGAWGYNPSNKSLGGTIVRSPDESDNDYGFRLILVP
jgi:serine/threonine protein kinase